MHVFLTALRQDSLSQICLRTAAGLGRAFVRNRIELVSLILLFAPFCPGVSSLLDSKRLFKIGSLHHSEVIGKQAFFKFKARPGVIVNVQEAA